MAVLLKKGVKSEIDTEMSVVPCFVHLSVPSCISYSSALCHCFSLTIPLRYFFNLWRNSPTGAQGTLLLRFLDHTQICTCTRYNFSEGANSTSQRQLLTQHTTNTIDKHPCTPRD